MSSNNEAHNDKTANTGDFLDAELQDLSRRLSNADFSHRSRNRAVLRRRLLAGYPAPHTRSSRMNRANVFPRALGFGALLLLIITGLGWLLSNALNLPDQAAGFTPLPSDSTPIAPEENPTEAPTTEPAGIFDAFPGPLTFNPFPSPQGNFFYASVFANDLGLGDIEFGSIDGGWCDRTANGAIIAIVHEKMTSTGAGDFSNEPATLRWVSLHDFGVINEPFPDVQVMNPPTFSPEGFRLAFSACPADGNCGLYLYDLETGDLERISPHQPAKPVLWGPDGTEIAFEVPAGDQVQLHVISAETGSTTFLGERVNPGSALSYWSRTLPEGVSGVERCAAAPGPDLPDPISMDSDSEAIRLRMLFSHTLWHSMWVDARIDDFGGAAVSSQRIQIWLDQPARARVLSGQPGGQPALLWISDGERTRTGEEVRVEPYNPPTTDSNAVYPHPMTYILPTPLSSLLFPAGLAQRGGTYIPVSLEQMAGRESLVVDWQAPWGEVIDRFWVDTQTGVLLRQQNRGKDGSGQLTTDYIINDIRFNPGFVQATFDRLADYPPEFAAGPEDVFIDDSTPEPVGTPETSRENGEIFLLLPAPGGMETAGIARFPAACLVTGGACPQPEFVQNVPQGFAYLPLDAWSPDSEKLFYSVSGPTDGIWIYDRAADAWTQLDVPYFSGGVWSPDGAWLVGQPILFGSAESNPILLARSDGAAWSELLADQPGYKSPFGWTDEDGILLVNTLDNLVTEDDPFVYYEIQLADRESEAVEVLAEIRLNANTGRFSEPVLSPDRSRFVYTVGDWRAGNSEVHLYDLASRSEMVYFLNLPGSLSWTPDSRKLMATAALGYSCKISMLETDGSGLIDLYAGDWGGGCLFTFSPDGRYLIVPESVQDPNVPRLTIVDIETGESRLVELPDVGVLFEWPKMSWLP